MLCACREQTIVRANEWKLQMIVKNCQNSLCCSSYATLKTRLIGSSLSMQSFSRQHLSTLKYWWQKTSCSRLMFCNQPAEEVRKLPQNHEEADKRMYMHMLHAIKGGFNTILIASPDTDAPDAEIGMITGTGKYKRIISISKVLETIGSSAAKSMPLVHALTGCDGVGGFNNWPYFWRTTSFALVLKKSINHWTQHLKRSDWLNNLYVSCMDRKQPRWTILDISSTKLALLPHLLGHRTTMLSLSTYSGLFIRQWCGVTWANNWNVPRQMD